MSINNPKGIGARLALAALLALALTSSCGSPPDEFTGQGGIFDSPVGVVVNGDYGYVMNANFDLSDDKDGAITVLDLPRCLVNRKDCIIGRETTPPFVGKMIMSSDRQIGYLANRRNNSVLLVDLSDPADPRLMDLDETRSGDQGIKVGIEPFAMALSEDDERLYVANLGSGDLSIVDVPGRTLIKNEQVQWGINEVKIPPGGRYAYLTNRGLQSVVLFDTVTNRINTAFALGSRRTGIGIDTRGIDFTPDGRWAFIAARQPESLLVVDTEKLPSNPDDAVVDLLPLDLRPTAVRVTPDGAEVWVTNFASNNIYIFDTQTRAPLSVVTVGSGPSDITFTEENPDDPGHYYALITNFDSHNVSLIDARSKEYIWAIP